MDNQFEKSFSDYLIERTESTIAWLRENNSEYAAYLKERSEIIQKKHSTVTECEESIKRLNEVDDRIRDLENSALFLAGVQELKNINDAVSSKEFMKKFTNAD